MKHFLHILMAALLLISTAGISVSRHMCGEMLHDLAINHQAENCFGGHGMDMEGCCTNETQTFRVSDDFQLQQSTNIPTDFKLHYIVPFSQVYANAPGDQPVRFLHSFESPPLLHWNEIFILVQSFLI